MAACDETLVKHCLLGRAASLREFVTRFQGVVFGVCYRMLGHRQDAEDVSQEVFARALRSLHCWDAKRPLRPWLLAIASNRCRTYLAKRLKKPAHIGIIGELPTTDTAVSSLDLAEELQLALDKLREEYRTCFVLYHQQELSCAEIAEIMKCPSGTVKTWLYRARGELANHLRRRGVVPAENHELH